MTLAKKKLGLILFSVAMQQPAWAQVNTQQTATTNVRHNICVEGVVDHTELCEWGLWTRERTQGNITIASLKTEQTYEICRSHSMRDTVQNEALPQSGDMAVIVKGNTLIDTATNKPLVLNPFSCVTVSGSKIELTSTVTAAQIQKGWDIGYYRLISDTEETAQSRTGRSFQTTFEKAPDLAKNRPMLISKTSEPAFTRVCRLKPSFKVDFIRDNRTVNLIVDDKEAAANGLRPNSCMDVAGSKIALKYDFQPTVSGAKVQISGVIIR